MLNDPIYNPKFEKRYWWNFEEVIEIGGISGDIPWSDEQIYSFLYNFNLEDLFSSLKKSNYEKVIQPVVDIFNLIYKRFADHYCFETDTDVLSTTEKRINAQYFVIKLFNVIEYTYKKYQKVIDLYNDNYATLMRELSMTTESGSRYNDTPQEDEVSLSYEENRFTTNLTKSKSVTTRDSDTPIAKIEEIFRNYRNVLLDWLNEFDSLFVEVHNV